MKQNHLHNVPLDIKLIRVRFVSPWPDAVLVGHSDAGVEGVELHDRRHSRVTVDEYLIIQTGDTWNESGTKGRMGRGGGGGTESC